MNQQDFYNAKNVLHARVIQTARSIGPQAWIDNVSGQVTYSTDAQQKCFYDRVVGEINALTAEIASWEL